MISSFICKMDFDITIEEDYFASSKARYEFYIPKTNKRVGAVLLLHGFQCKLDYHRGTASMLARKGIACLLVDLLPLMSLFRKTLHVLRHNNVKATISYVEWLNSRKEIEPGHVILAGHSAGGAVALEAAARLLGKGSIRGLLLLDTVPWLSTLKAGQNAEGLVAPLPTNIRQMISPTSCVVASLRGEPTSFNANGLILEQLSRGIGKSDSSTDIKILGARHGDFMSGNEEDYADGVGGIIGNAMQCIGLFSKREVRLCIQELILAFCTSLLEIAPDAYATKVDELLRAGLVDVKQINDSLPSRLSNLPYFIK